MRTLIVIAALSVLPSFASAQTAVDGYYRQDGTYIAPHYRSSPNSTVLDNYGTKPNVNPFTGEQGTRDAYAPSYNSNTLRGLGGGNDMLGRMR
jgi:hypothetical protein